MVLAYMGRRERSERGVGREKGTQGQSGGVGVLCGQKQIDSDPFDCPL